MYLHTAYAQILAAAAALGMPSSSVRALAQHFARRIAAMRMHCSMLGAWGSRTAGGKLYTMRNLDWAANTGIADNKLIAIFHPAGKHAHATIGFAGMIVLLHRRSYPVRAVRITRRYFFSG